MAQENQDEQMEAYTEAVESGLYAKKSGLTGKYDNVRRYWEDEITRQFLRPHLMKLLERCKSRMDRLRILDLGCGSADGFELLTGVTERDASLQKDSVNLLVPEVLGLYRGIDLNGDLLDQARAIYGDNPKMVLEQSDFTYGLDQDDKDNAYDLYFTSYGTCSHHNEDETLVKMLTDIARHTQDYSIIVADWLGRYSYEWQSLWKNDLDELRNMDYVVSYIYEKEERERKRYQLQHLTLRLMSRQESDPIVQEASERAGVEIKPLCYFDRSVFTGRHMDTADYNKNARPIRKAVNSLHEENLRTDLDDLLVDYVPKDGFEFLNRYFENLQVCWNTLVQYVDHLLDAYDEHKREFTRDPDPVPATYPDPLRDMMERMKRVVSGVGWMGFGMPRENVIEPQLGYALRYLISNLQQGKGCAHGLVGIFEVDKG